MYIIKLTIMQMLCVCSDLYIFDLIFGKYYQFMIDKSHFMKRLRQNLHIDLLMSNIQYY